MTSQKKGKKQVAIIGVMVIAVMVVMAMAFAFTAPPKVSAADNTDQTQSGNGASIDWLTGNWVNWGLLSSAGIQTDLSAGYYKVTKDITLSGATGDAPSGIRLLGNVHIYVAEGVTLTCIGAKAEDEGSTKLDGGSTKVGGAGIEVPDGTRLFLYGKGKVVARGGDAGRGANGVLGGKPGTSVDGITGYLAYKSGWGGDGGNGGNGAGAGIGTRGALGAHLTNRETWAGGGSGKDSSGAANKYSGPFSGAAGNASITNNFDHTNYVEAANMGTMYMYDDIKVETYGGSVVAENTYNFSESSGKNMNDENYYLRNEGTSNSMNEGGTGVIGNGTHMFVAYPGQSGGNGWSGGSAPGVGRGGNGGRSGAGGVGGGLGVISCCGGSSEPNYNHDVSRSGCYPADDDEYCGRFWQQSAQPFSYNIFRNGFGEGDKKGAHDKAGKYSYKVIETGQAAGAQGAAVGYSFVSIESKAKDHDPKTQSWSGTYANGGKATNETALSSSGKVYNLTGKSGNVTQNGFSSGNASVTTTAYNAKLTLDSKGNLRDGGGAELKPGSGWINGIEFSEKFTQYRDVDNAGKITSLNITNGRYRTPTASGYDFDGYYTSKAGGTQIIRSNGSFVSEIINPDSGSETLGPNSKFPWALFDLASNDMSNLEPNLNGLKLYARWIPKQYKMTLKWDIDLSSPIGTGDQRIDEYTVTFDADMPVLIDATLPKQRGYTLTRIEGKVNEGTSDEETVQFYDAVTNEDGHTAAIAAGNGWWMVPEDTTLYARWKANEYQIVFNPAIPLGGDKIGSQSMPATFGTDLPTPEILNKPGKQTDGTIIPEVRFKRQNYTFKGFYSRPLGKGLLYYKVESYNEATDEVTLGAGEPAAGSKFYTEGVLTLYPLWEPKEYAVEYWSYDDNHFDDNAKGSAVHVKSVMTKYNSFKPVDQFGKYNENGSGDSVFDKPLVRLGYRFLGWGIEESVVDAWYLPYRDYLRVLDAQAGAVSILYAIWEEVPSYKVVFNLNGGDGGAPATIKAYTDQKYLIPTDLIPTRKAYTFSTWNDAPSGTGKKYPVGTELNSVGYLIERNVTLYAVWIMNNSIIFNANGGTYQAPPSILYPVNGETIVISYDNLPILLGHTFLGWAESKTATVPVYTQANGKQFIMGANAVVLYAVWKANTYEINYPATSPLFTFSVKPTEYKYGEDYTFTLDVDTFKVNVSTMTVSVNGVIWPVKETVKEGTIVKYKYVSKYAINEQRVLVLGINPAKFAVSLDGDGGTGEDLTSYEYGKGAMLPAGATWSKKGYVFSAWLDNDGNQQTQISTSESGAKSFKARWTPITYNISYNINGGTGTTPALQSATYDVEVAVKDGEALFKTLDGTNYRFLGWSTNRAAVVREWLSGENAVNLSYTQGTTAVLYAVYDLPTYVISYVGNGGSYLGQTNFSQAATRNTTADLTFDNVVREGYAFLGWAETQDATVAKYTKSGLSQIVEIIKNAQLFAVWKANSYTILFHGNGGALRNGNESYDPLMSYKYDAKFKLWKNAFYNTDTNKAFKGWAYDSKAGVPYYNDEQQVKNIVSIDGQIVNLYAVWGSVKTVYLLYDTNGATWQTDEDNNVLLQPAQAVEYKTDNSAHTTVAFDYPPILAGYTFSGWQMGVDGKVFMEGDADLRVFFSEQANITMYAVWVLKAYQIKFEANGGSGFMATMRDVSYSEAKKLTINSFTRSGYVYKGWSMKADALVAEFVDGQLVKSLPADGNYEIIDGKTVIKLYAVWVPENAVYAIYDANGGYAAPQSLAMAPNEDVKISEKVPTYYGFDFLHWQYKVLVSGSEVTKTINKGGIINLSSTAHLVAVWKAKIKYTVLYSDQKGLGSIPLDAKTYYIDDTITAKFNVMPYRIGYTFAGWSYNGNALLEDKTGKSSFVLTKDIVDELFGVSGLTEITLEAVWEKNAYEIVFNKTDGSGVMEKQVIYYDEETALSNNTFIAPKGYMLGGWAVSLDNLSDKIFTYVNNELVLNLTSEKGGIINLYATWIPLKVKVTLNLDYVGQISEEIEVDYDKLMPTRLVPQRTGYTFTGFFTEKNGKGKMYYDAKMTATKSDFEKNTTLYAYWEGVKYNIRFQNSEDLIDIAIGSYEQTEFVIPTAKQIGFEVPRGKVLVGWSTNQVNVQFEMGQKYNLWEQSYGSDVILYAILETSSKSSVVYSAEDSTNVPIDSNTYYHYDIAEVNFAQIPQRKGYMFAGYSFKIDSTTVDFDYQQYVLDKAAGADLSKYTFEITGNAALYAIFIEPIKEFKKKIDTGEIIVTSESGFYPTWSLVVKNIELDADSISNLGKSDFQRVRAISKAYEIKIVDQNGNTVDVNFATQVKIPVPSNLEGKKFFVYHVSNGVSEKIDYKLSKDGKFVTFKTINFSEFVFTTEAPSLMIPTIVGGGVAIIILGLALLAAKKYGKMKRKNNLTKIKAKKK